MRFWLAFIAGIWLLVAATGSIAANYPDRPIAIVVPSAPGGLSDGFVKLIGNEMTRAWGQPVIMDHRPGAAGIIGTQYVAQAKPDGYTLLMGNIGPLAINPGLYPNLPYDAEKQFVPISLIAVYPNVLVVNPSLPIESVNDLIRAAKDKPGTLHFASAGAGQSHHLSGEMFKAMAGVDIVHVPYKGSGPALTDLLGGHVQMMFSNLPAALPYISSGRLRPLGVTGLKRSEALPDVPTIDEAGVSGYNVISWLALVAPAETPPEILHRLRDIVTKAMASPEAQKYLDLLGATVGTGTPSDLAKFFADEQTKWRTLIEKANIKVQ